MPSALAGVVEQRHRHARLLGHEPSRPACSRVPAGNVDREPVAVARAAACRRPDTPSPRRFAARQRVVRLRLAGLDARSAPPPGPAAAAASLRPRAPPPCAGRRRRATPAPVESATGGGSSGAAGGAASQAAPDSARPATRDSGPAAIRAVRRSSIQSPAAQQAAPSPRSIVATAAKGRDCIAGRPGAACPGTEYHPAGSRPSAARLVPGTRSYARSGRRARDSRRRGTAARARPCAGRNSRASASPPCPTARRWRSG